MNEHQVIETFHRVRDDIVVGPPPVLRVTAAATRRRRRSQVVAAAAAVVAVVAGVGVVLALGDGDAQRPEPAVRLVENPAPVAWWGDGRLHVAHAVVETTQPTTIVSVGDGVVTWTEPRQGEDRGPLMHVTDDGTETVIGEKAYGDDLAADPSTGWVAWVDHPDDDTTVLVVFDTTTGEEVTRRELADDGPRHEVLDEGPHPIAIENGEVYYASWDADYRWDVAGDGEPERVTDVGTYLLARESGVELTRSYDAERGYGPPVLRRDGETDVELPDSVGLLSPDGRYVLGLTSIGSYPRLFDVATQGRVPIGLTDDRAVVDVAFGRDGTVTFAFGTPWERPDDGDLGAPPPVSPWTEPFDLVTCEIASATCQTVADGIEGDNVVLPD